MVYLYAHHKFAQPRPVAIIPQAIHLRLQSLHFSMLPVAAGSQYADNRYYDCQFLHVDVCCCYEVSHSFAAGVRLSIIVRCVAHFSSYSCI